ncbi:MAG: hypothetical protein HQ541_01155 [Mariniphaga sp.]|nr:hypothetical protein [Mariniphaga sp.]
MKPIFTILFISILFLNFTSAQEDAPENTSCSQASELLQDVKNDTGFVILDLRQENMFIEMHIENAIYYDVFSEGFDSWLET